MMGIVMEQPNQTEERKGRTLAVLNGLRLRHLDDRIPQIPCNHSYKILDIDLDGGLVQMYDETLSEMHGRPIHSLISLTQLGNFAGYQLK